MIYLGTYYAKGLLTDITATKIVTAGETSSSSSPSTVILFNGYLFNDTTKLKTTINTGTITIGISGLTSEYMSTTTISFYDVDDTITGTDSVTTSTADEWHTKEVTIPATTVKIIISSTTNTYGTDFKKWTDVYMTVTAL